MLNPRIEPNSTDPASSMDILVVYEDVETGLRARHLFDRVLGRMAKKTDLRLHLWNLHLLDHAPEQASLSEVTRRAAIIVLSLRDDGEFWHRAKEWFEEKVREGGFEPGALVLLVESSKDRTAKASAMLTDFEHFAQENDISFFHSCSTTPLASPNSRERITERAHVSSSVLGNILDREGSHPRIDFI